MCSLHSKSTRQRNHNGNRCSFSESCGITKIALDTLTTKLTHLSLTPSDPVSLDSMTHYFTSATPLLLLISPVQLPAHHVHPGFLNGKNLSAAYDRVSQLLFVRKKTNRTRPKASRCLTAYFCDDGIADSKMTQDWQQFSLLMAHLNMKRQENT